MSGAKVYGKRTQQCVENRRAEMDKEWARSIKILGRFRRRVERWQRTHKTSDRLPERDESDCLAKYFAAVTRVIEAGKGLEALADSALSGLSPEELLGLVHQKAREVVLSWSEDEWDELVRTRGALVGAGVVQTH